MDRSDTIGKDAKYHVHNEDKRFLGTLCCKAEDVVRTGAVLRGELYIKVGASIYACTGDVWGQHASSSIVLL